MHPQSRKTAKKKTEYILHLKKEKKERKFERENLLMTPITQAKVANNAETSLQLSETESQ